MRCAMTGLHLKDPSEGIWDDGEWISWHWINEQIADQELREQYPHASTSVVRIFEELVTVAQQYREETGRYLQIWGELGEVFVEIKFGLKRHAPGHRGSDGRIGNDWVEVKTISPEKTGTNIQVKRAGNFNKLIVVKISEDFEFEAKVIDRKKLGKGRGKHAKVSWSSMSVGDIGDA